MNRDLAFGACGAIVAAGYYGLAASIPRSALADAVGPQGLPMVYAGVLLLLSLMLIVRALRTRNGEPRIPDPGSLIPDPRSPIPDPRSPIPDPRSPIPDPRSPRVFRVTGMLAIGAAYIVLVPWLGYVVALAGLILATTWYQSRVITRTTALVAIAGAIVFWLVFVALLGIPQPPGIWTQGF